MSKSISKTGSDLISSFEGIRLNAYDDGVGVWTIGIGTTIYPNGVKVKKGDKCSWRHTPFRNLHVID